MNEAPLARRAKPVIQNNPSGKSRGGTPENRPTHLFPITTEDGWETAMAEYATLRAKSDAQPIDSDGADILMECHATIRDRLMTSPAPNVQALLWKMNLHRENAGCWELTREDWDLLIADVTSIDPPAPAVRPELATDECASHLIHAQTLSDVVDGLLDPATGRRGALQRAKTLLHLQYDELTRALNALESEA